MALDAWGVDDLDAMAVTTRLFEVEPAPAPAPTAAVTSDRRDGFYLWWVFVRPSPDGVAATVREFVTGS